MKKILHRSSATALVASLAIFASSGWAQQAPAPAATKKAPATPTAAQVAAGTAETEQVLVLTPFEVAASSDTGYGAVTTLAGNRLNTDLRDIGDPEVLADIADKAGQRDRVRRQARIDQVIIEKKLGYSYS